jgi:sulfur-carrier protein
MIRVILPTHLRRLANSERQIEVEVQPPVTLRTVLDALEATYPMLRGTIRDQTSKERRAFIRFFACGQDYSLTKVDDPLPESVAQGIEPLHVIGAIAGG